MSRNAETFAESGVAFVEQFSELNMFSWNLAGTKPEHINDLIAGIVEHVNPGVFIFQEFSAHMSPEILPFLDNYWLLLSSAEFILVQVLMVIGILATRQMREIITSKNGYCLQRRNCWL